MSFSKNVHFNCVDVIAYEKIRVFLGVLRGGRGRITDKLVNVQVYVSNVIVPNVGGGISVIKRRQSLI